jgi:PAS domain S-box-containing protein
MAKSRKSRMTDAVYRPHRNGERLPSRELVNRTVQELVRLARIPQENPDPVLRVSAGHVLLYRNPAGKELCRLWGCGLGQKVPAAIQTIVSAALAEGAVVRREATFGSHTYGLTVVPSVAAGCVNIYARDITDCQRAQAALQQTEQRFRTIFDTTSDGIFLHDLETGKLTMCNKSFLQMLDYTEEEFTKLAVADLHPEADLPFIHAQISEFLRGGKPIRHDIRFRRKDGSILFADVSPDLVQLDGRRYVVVALKDVTERRRMEEDLRQHAEHLEELVEARTRELQESETRYRTLYHTIADGIFVMGTDGRIAEVNDSACAQLGYTRAELIGLPLTAISARPGFDLGEILDRLHAAGSLSYETVHRRKDGTTIPVELSVARVEYRGQPAALGVARDITERVGAQESLRFTQFAIDHTADAAFWMTEDARFFYVNEAACQALGYPRAELLEMTVYDIDPAFTEDLWRESWRKLKAQKSIVLETLHRAKDGRIYPVEIRANYLEYGGREYDCAFARDISERKRTEEALREWNATLENKVTQRTAELQRRARQLQELTLELSQAEDRERKRIADLLHDDVQQTLAAAKFHLNLLSSEPRSEEESREIVEQVRHMLKDAIEKARHLSHELSPALYQVDLTAILEWLARHMQEKHGLTVRLEVHGPVDSPSEPLKAFLYKVVQELLFNVVKHAGVPEARIRVRRRGPYLYLSVVDKGRGFDPRRLETTPGFGLQGIRERVQLLGGRMKIRSTPGTGSTLLIVVPCEAPARATGPAGRGEGQVRAEGPA